MDINEIKNVLIEKLALQEVHVTGNDSHFRVIAVDKRFDKMRPVEKQQTIYRPLKEYIADKRIHALSIETYTPKEWQRDRKLNGF